MAARRLIITSVAGSALLFGGLTFAESVGTSASPAPSSVRLTHSQHVSQVKPAGDTSHCSDGKGKDVDKNKHCRIASGGT